MHANLHGGLIPLGGPPFPHFLLFHVFCVANTKMATPLTPFTLRPTVIRVLGPPTALMAVSLCALVTFVGGMSHTLQTPPRTSTVWAPKGKNGGLKGEEFGVPRLQPRQLLSRELADTDDDGPSPAPDASRNASSTLLGTLIHGALSNLSTSTAGDDDDVSDHRPSEHGSGSGATSQVEHTPNPLLSSPPLRPPYTPHTPTSTPTPNPTYLTPASHLPTPTAPHPLPSPTSSPPPSHRPALMTTMAPRATRAPLGRTGVMTTETKAAVQRPPRMMMTTMPPPTRKLCSALSMRADSSGAPAYSSKP